MESLLAVPLQVGMIVNCVRRSGEFRIRHVWKVNWIDGRNIEVYSVECLATNIHYDALETDLFVPGELKKYDEITRYEIGIEKQPGDEQNHVIIKGESDMLKYIVHLVLEDFACLDASSIIDMKILKEIKYE